MTRVVAAAVALALCACAAAERAQPVARVLVLNIHAGKDAAGKANLQRVAELVRATAADIVLLQEVDRGTRRSPAATSTPSRAAEPTNN